MCLTSEIWRNVHGSRPTLAVTDHLDTNPLSERIRLAGAYKSFDCSPSRTSKFRNTISTAQSKSGLVYLFYLYFRSTIWRLDKCSSCHRRSPLLRTAATHLEACVTVTHAASLLLRSIPHCSPGRITMAPNMVVLGLLDGLGIEQTCDLTPSLKLTLTIS